MGQGECVVGASALGGGYVGADDSCCTMWGGGLMTAVVLFN